MLKRYLFALVPLMAVALSAGAQSTPSVSWTRLGLLDEALTGTSCLFRWEGNYWTANDHGELSLHLVDTVTGASTRVINTGLIVNDLEEIAINGDYFYLGDFGNNMGSRTDLRVLRLHKDSLLSGHAVVDTIFFSYSDQTNFTYNNMETDYDCESFVVSGDSIYLFTKQWTTQSTTCYTLPATPGRHVAQPVGTAPVSGLVTGACLLPELRILLLCGYSTTLTPFVYICYDFHGNNFFAGQQQKVNTGSLGYQTEGIASADGVNVYLTNEHFSYSSYIDIAQQLSKVNLGQFLDGYLHPDTENMSMVDDDSAAVIFPNPATERVTVRNLTTLRGVTSGSVLRLYDAAGRMVSTHTITDSSLAKGLTISLQGLPAGVYQVKVSAASGRAWTLSFVKSR